MVWLFTIVDTEDLRKFVLWFDDYRWYQLHTSTIYYVQGHFSLLSTAVESPHIILVVT